MPSKGNPEIRFRASPEIHGIAEDMQNQLGLPDKSAGLKLLITLGNDRIVDVVNYIDGVTHPLTDRQFEDFFLSLKIRVRQARDQRKSIKNRRIQT